MSIFFPVEKNYTWASNHAVWRPRYLGVQPRPWHVSLEVEPRSPQEISDCTRMQQKDGIEDKNIVKNHEVCHLIFHSLFQCFQKASSPE